ncbi:MAG: hypothetical protein AAF990_19275 [Bacteroidota bacterium]
MNLKKGLNVYSNLSTIADQLSINNGTVEAIDIAGLNYEDGAHIPQKGWRSLNARERKLLIAKASDVHYSKSLYVGEIPTKLKHLLQSLGLDQCTHPDQVFPKFEENETLVKKVTKELNGFLRHLSSNQDYKFHRITRAMPNRETITCHYVDEAFIYIGLHIDQSKHFTIHSAYKSGNRISINLSKETRTLAFINLTLIQVFNMLKEKIDTHKTIVDPDNIAQLFFKYYPNYPTTKVALKPYQYYVAPTDNFLHDASTVGNKEIDITLVYTGLFDMPKIFD